jgi:hypothetical protein
MPSGWAAPAAQQGVGRARFDGLQGALAALRKLGKPCRLKDYYEQRATTSALLKEGLCKGVLP